MYVRVNVLRRVSWYPRRPLTFISQLCVQMSPWTPLRRPIGSYIHILVVPHAISTTYNEIFLSSIPNMDAWLTVLSVNVQSSLSS